MKKIEFLIAVFFLCLVQITSGQNDCNEKFIIGEWKITNNIHWGIHTNVDSLRIISKGDTSANVTIQFKIDGTYQINFENGTKQRKGFYGIDTEKCEIILNRKKKNLINKKVKERSNWEIIFLDKEILIYKEDNNPHNYATHVLWRN